MLVIKCPICGKRIVWDDFQPTDIRCSSCGERLNIHREFKKNIDLRNQTDAGKIFKCPRCRGIISRRWFMQCPHCRYWLFGPFSFHGKWPFVLMVALVYIIFSVLYLVYIR
jgi:DNA-directed RNA polymerase subunit RPC12/RpoP